MSDLADRLKAARTTTTAPTTVETAPVVKPTAKPVEKKYQHYASSRVSTRMLTKTGREIKFVNYQFITDDKDLIEYLNGEIAMGLRAITKGELLTHAESNPMEILKAALKKELESEIETRIRAEIEAEMKGKEVELPDMGKTEGATTINPATSKDVASGAPTVAKS